MALQDVSGNVAAVTGSARIYSLGSVRAVKGFVERTSSAIKSGRLLPGRVLDLSRESDELRLSVVKLRQALQPLEVEGLLYFSGPSRAVVEDLDVHLLERVFAVRRAVQPEVFAQAALVSPLSTFDTARVVTEDFTVVDWSSDEVYSTLWQTYSDFIEPVISSFELSLLTEFEVMCERSQRIGYDELCRLHPAALDDLATGYRERIDACRMRSATAARDAELRFLGLVEGVARLSVRAARTASS